MNSKFQSAFNEAVNTFLTAEAAAGIQATNDVAPSPQPAGQPQSPPVQDAAAPTQQPADPSAGYGIYKNLVVNLLRSLSMLAGALASKDQEEITAVQKLLPDSIADTIQQTIGSLNTAEPATVAQMVDTLLNSLNPTPLGA